MLMERLTEIALASLMSQIGAGASAVQVFDSWAGALSPMQYERYVLPWAEHLFTELASGDLPTLHELWDPQEEADLLLDTIHELRDRELSLNDIAVLYRNHVQSATLQVELTRAGIPFVIHSGVKFFEQAHIKDLTAFLKVVYNPLDEIAWMRILKLLPGVGNTTAHRIFSIFHTQQAVRLTQNNAALQFHVYVLE
jgi:superfamily I DNA/RNA helicase